MLHWHWNEKWEKTLKMDVQLAKAVSYICWHRGMDWVFNYSDTGIIIEKEYKNGVMREYTIRDWKDAEFWFGSEILQYRKESE
jgi:hypothetical protein